MRQVTTAKVNCLGKSITLSGYAEDHYHQRLAEAATPEFGLLTMTTLLLKPGQTVVDVGANIGFYSLAALSIMNNDGAAYAFEPSLASYELLEKNVADNGLTDSIHCFNYGLGSAAGKHQLLYNDTELSGAFVSDEQDVAKYHDTSETISIKVLDEVRPFTACDLLKVDVEGYEPAFLKGAVTTIRKFKPACLMEANHFCLNAFTRTALPDYIDQVQAIFPYVYAFDENSIIDVGSNRFDFLYRNIANNQVQNLYCDFNANRCKDVVALYQRILSAATEQSELRAENESLKRELAEIKNSRSHKLAERINRIVGR